MTETNLSKPYVERLGFTPMLVFGVLTFLAVAAACAWLLTEPEITNSPAGWAFILISIVIFGGEGLSVLVAALRRQVALRVDHGGVTLGRPPGLMTHHGLWWRTPVVAVPWGDIEAVVLFGLRTPKVGSLSFVGLRLRPGAVDPPREPKRLGIWRHLNIMLGQERPPDSVSLYRQIIGWRLDEVRLVEAVAEHAPDVSVVELEDGSAQTIRPLVSLDPSRPGREVDLDEAGSPGTQPGRDEDAGDAVLRIDVTRVP